MGFAFAFMKEGCCGMDNDIYHIPVMGEEVLEYLNPKPGDVIVDGTTGTGGHALEILKKIGPAGKLIAIDRDLESLNVAKARLQDFSSQCHFVHSDFRNVNKVLRDLNISRVDGMLFDLGISSFQLNNPERGFSLKAEGPLDMRMDKDTYISAYDLVNSLSEKEISSILKNFGEERWHQRIARFLVAQRSKTPIDSTADLRAAILRAIPSGLKHQKIDPATRTFQALRIAVNRELEALEILLEHCLDCLKIGGRFCVISFHSLEDRIVKNKFRFFFQNHLVKLLTKKPLTPSEKEIEHNSRSRSAKLRALEKIKE